MGNQNILILQIRAVVFHTLYYLLVLTGLLGEFIRQGLGYDEWGLINENGELMNRRELFGMLGAAPFALIGKEQKQEYFYDDIIKGMKDNFPYDSIVMLFSKNGTIYGKVMVISPEDPRGIKKEIVDLMADTLKSDYLGEDA